MLLGRYKLERVTASLGTVITHKAAKQEGVKNDFKIVMRIRKKVRNKLGKISLFSQDAKSFNMLPIKLSNEFF